MLGHQKLAEENTYGTTGLNSLYGTNKDLEEELDADEIGSKFNNGGLLYPPSIWELEFASIFFFFFIQIFRLNLGYNANRTEHTLSMIMFMVFTLFGLLFCIYFSFATTYVLLIEIAVGVIAMFFAFMEIIMALLAIIKFKKALSN
ncbi:UNKNOWN [Stylonychia lemnae]|uniref:Transmembrane protein n=1 Tax=Stylonychia lemnae TaxID=5949 RepID=A0A078AZE7_STYLE|nr:UNKNOWN [Stylonychia lemnae]|eukprot:CDW87524.1 UNKNOWN [Stylonychia lemnae]